MLVTTTLTTTIITTVTNTVTNTVTITVTITVAITVTITVTTTDIATYRAAIAAKKGGSRSRGRVHLSEIFFIPVCFYGPLEQENMLSLLNFQ